MAGASRHCNACSPSAAHELYGAGLRTTARMGPGGIKSCTTGDRKTHQSWHFQAAQQMFAQLLALFLSSHGTAQLWGNEQWIQQVRQKDFGQQDFHTTLGESGKCPVPALDAAQLIPSREEQVLQTQKTDKNWAVQKRGRVTKWFLTEHVSVKNITECRVLGTGLDLYHSPHF